MTGFLVTRSTPSDATVEVDATVTVGTFATELDTQIIYPAVLDEDMPNADEHLKRYAADRASPLRVRLLLSTDGAYVTTDRRHKPTLPAGWTRGDWDFTSLDLLVGDVYRANGRPVVDIGYMPDWMWNCSTGQPVDPTFVTFGEYAARLVAYYNNGGFTAEDGGRVENPAGASRPIATWELWNEPNYQTLACLRGASTSGVPAISPAQYLLMWNAAAPRMRAVDPTIRLAGPATSAAMTGKTPDYLQVLMSDAAIKPDVVTFHAYGSYSPDETDGCLFDNAPPIGRKCFQGGLPLLLDGLRRVRSWAPGTETWLTELNVLASYGNDPRARNWNALGAAWQASAFARLSAAGADSLFQYSFVHPGGNQFSLLDWTKGSTFGTPLLPYWTGYYLARFFPPGSVILRSKVSQSGVDALAVRLASGEIHVLLVNRKVATSSDVGGAGVPAAIQVTVSGIAQPKTVTLWQLDGQTPLPDGPQAQVIGPGAGASVSFSGYGVAILELK